MEWDLLFFNIGLPSGEQNTLYNAKPKNMKQVFELTLLLFLLSLCSCKNRPYSHTLAMVDSLTYVNPDSVISLLSSLKTQISDGGESAQMYYRLLQIKANDNAYIPYTSDSVIRQLLNYYESKKDKKILPETYYYAGRVYLDLGDAPQALEYLQKALEISKEKTDYWLLSKIYNQIGVLYLYQNICNKALGAFKEGFYYTKKSGDSTYIVYNLRNIGRVFARQNNIDSASYYYEEAREMAKSISDARLVKSVDIEMAGIYKQLGKYEKAFAAIQRSHVADEDPLRCSILASLCCETGKIDSAQYYYMKLLSARSRYDNASGYYREKRDCYKGLSEIARQKGKLVEALNYMDRYLAYADSIQKAVNAESIRKMNALYNYQLREKENNVLKDIAQKQKVWIVILLASIILIAIVTLSASTIYYLRKKQRKMQVQRQHEKLKEIADEQYRSSQQFILDNEKRIGILKDKLQDAENQKSELEEDLQKAEKELLELTNKQIETRQKIQTLSETAFRASQIYRDFYHVAGMPNSERISAKEKITTKDWEELTIAINQTYNNFTERLHIFYPNISEHELRICILIKIAIPPMSIAKLTSHSKQAITSSRKKLYEKTHNEVGTPDLWDEFVRNF